MSRSISFDNSRIPVAIDVLQRRAGRTATSGPTLDERLRVKFNSR